jgi:hypothetical protein
MSRTALLISCSEEEATKIRTRAEYDFRGVSAYILNIVLRAVELDEKLLGQFQTLVPLPSRIQVPGRRTAVLVRCSDEQASRIRAAAKRRHTTISGFVLNCLNRSWGVALGIG